jgi:hypothetical protein
MVNSPQSANILKYSGHFFHIYNLKLCVELTEQLFNTGEESKLVLVLNDIPAVLLGNELAELFFRQAVHTFQNLFLLLLGEGCRVAHCLVNVSN